MKDGNPTGNNQWKKKSGTASNDAVPLVSQRQASKMLNVGEASVDRARTVIEHGIPELIEAVEEGKMTVTKGQTIARLPEPEQKEVLTAPGTLIFGFPLPGRVQRYGWG